MRFKPMRFNDPYRTIFWPSPQNSAFHFAPVATPKLFIKCMTNMYAIPARDHFSGEDFKHISKINMPCHAHLLIRIANFVIL